MKKLFEVITGLLALFFRPNEVDGASAPAVEPKPGPAEWPSLVAFQAATGLSDEIARNWYLHVRAVCQEFSIVGSVRIAAFLT